MKTTKNNNIFEKINLEERIEKFEKKYPNLSLDAILVNKSDLDDVLVMANNGSEAFGIDCKTHKLKWRDRYPSMDERIFSELENEKDIIYMDGAVHEEAFFQLNNSCLEKIKYKEGLDLYIQHCKENEVYIDEEDFDIENILTLEKENKKYMKESKTCELEM